MSRPRRIDSRVATKTQATLARATDTLPPRFPIRGCYAGAARGRGMFQALREQTVFHRMREMLQTLEKGCGA